MHTPAFLAWAIEHQCPLRGGQDGSDPERTERQLRSARAVSDARREGRVLEGFCVDPPDGFRIDDALAIYGGEAAVRSVEGPWWRLAAHCPQCKAPWGEAAQRRCKVCGYRGPAAPQQKRHARGSRPYFPLARLLGAAQAAEFLTRYQAQRVRPGSPDPA